MKSILILVTAMLLCDLFTQAQVAVNTSGNPPAASAMLDVTSITKGMLVPRMTSLQRRGISTPAQGLMVYQTDSATGLYSFNGTIWKHLVDAVPTQTNPSNNSLLTFDGTNWVAKNLFIGNSGSNQPVSIIQPYLCMNYCIALVGVYPARNSANPFIGEVELYGFNFPPKDFATCDGQVMSINNNQALFSLLGTWYGGDGQTTFRLPDLRGRVAIHQGQGPGLSPYNIGQVGGSEAIYLTVPQLPAHMHTVIYQ